MAYAASEAGDEKPHRSAALRSEKPKLRKGRVQTGAAAPVPRQVHASTNQ
jgi:hypothetical protein